MGEKVVLKRYQETGDIKLVYEYGRLLEDGGWRFWPMRGGFLSPDGSTVFHCMTVPYQGQLMPTANRMREFWKTVQHLIRSGDFMCTESAVLQAPAASMTDGNRRKTQWIIT